MAGGARQGKAGMAGRGEARRGADGMAGNNTKEFDLKAVPKPKKKPSRRGKVKRLDNAFSLYIRNRDNWTCQTCGSMDKLKLQCGHLFSRVAYATRWDEANAYCQCAGCNMRHEYDPGPLTMRFFRDHSEAEYEALHAKFRSQAKFRDFELDAMIKSFEAQNKEYDK